MKVGKLVELLGQWDPDTNVRIRIAETDEDFEVEQGDYLEIMDERSVLMEYRDVVIIGDVPEE